MLSGSEALSEILSSKPQYFMTCVTLNVLNEAFKCKEGEGFWNLVCDYEHLSIGLVNYHTSPPK